MKRWCSKCKQDKNIDEFYTTSHKNDYCKVCKRQWHKEHRLKNLVKYKQRVNQYYKNLQQEIHHMIYDYLLNHPCVDCGEKDPLVLEFHHTRGIKKFNIGTNRRHYSWETIKTEIDKCVVVCANCHKKRTAKEQGWFKYTHQQQLKGVVAG